MYPLQKQHKFDLTLRMDVICMILVPLERELNEIE